MRARLWFAFDTLNSVLFLRLAHESCAEGDVGLLFMRDLIQCRGRYILRRKVISRIVIPTLICLGPVKRDAPFPGFKLFRRDRSSLFAGPGDNTFDGIQQLVLMIKI